MTPLQREALQMCLEYIETDAHERRHVRWKINEALAQPQQEPVAWAISYDGKTPYAIWPDGDGALLDLEVKRQGGTTCKLPLYASPPAQRKPLTDEQIKNIAARTLFPIAFARAIEAKHNIKGDA